MKKGFIKLGGFLVALMMAANAFASGSSLYKGALNNFLRFLSGDTSFDYIVAPPEGKAIFDNKILGMSTDEKEDLLDRSGHISSALSMSDMKISIISEAELNDEHLQTVRNYNNYILQTDSQFIGKTMGEIIPITKGYEVVVMIYSGIKPYWKEPAPVIVYKAGSNWFIISKSMAEIEEVLTLN